VNEAITKFQNAYKKEKNQGAVNSVAESFRKHPWASVEGKK